MPQRGGVWIALAALWGFAASAGAQTPLGRGDIALTGYNSTGTDEIAFVLLTDVEAGTAISFTERGWFAAGGFRSGEATFTLVTARAYPCGTELRAVMTPLAVFDPSGISAGTVSGSGLALSTAGDQVFVYQGPEPTAADESGLLTALQMNGPWDADATSANSSARPVSMTDGVDALSIVPEVDNARYDCSLVSATREVLVAAVHDAARWIRSDANPFDLTVHCSFSCTAPPTPTPTSTPAPTPTPTPELSPEPTAPPTPEPTVEPTPSPEPTAELTPAPLATATPAPTPSPHSTPVERVQNKAQQRCIHVLNRGFARVLHAQWAEVVRCLKAFAKGQEPAVAACVAADARGKVAEAQSGVERAASKRCTEPPDFGPKTAGPTAEHARIAARVLAADLFGEGDAGLASEANERERARCQRSVVKAVRKCQATHLAEFNRCKKGRLESGTIKSAASLASCLGADPKDRIALACDAGGAKPDPIRRALSSTCVAHGVDLVGVLDGCPEANETELAHSCVMRHVRCRTCLGLAAADSLPLDCDLYDDGAVNASCVP